jgi:NAD(P)-dependent dehydrogenase (short-subunit alcohol dehydrogenase family)
MIAYVTGAANGIGRAIALELADAGYDIVVMDVDAEAAAETAVTVSAKGSRSWTFRVDVSKWESVHSAIAVAAKEVGKPDVLVNSAGILRMGTVAGMSLEDWSITFRVNVDGVFHTCRAVVPDMVARRAGRIINVASWFGKVGKPHFSAYCASKFAVIGLTQSLAMEVAPAGVNVNAVCPGTVVNTEMRKVADAGARKLGQPTAQEREGTIPLGRAAQPEDIARVVRFLASDAAKYMTGQSVNVCGGLWLS